MAKHIFIVHGRDFKPSEKYLKKNYNDALKFGIERDFGKNSPTMSRFKDTKISFIYYGDKSNKFLRSVGRKYNPASDSIDRDKALALLKSYKSNQFTKATYNKVPGKTSLKEVAANVLGVVLAPLRLADNLITKVAPDMKHYWTDSRFGSDVRWSLTEPLAKAIKKGDEIMILSHSLGTLISYDVLWKFSHYAEYQHIRGKKVDLVTLGSPLGDETVKRKLKGSGEDGIYKYPHNIKHWVNIAAEDDFISYDGKISNDYKVMEKKGLLSSITDLKIYNPSERNGKSNPHHFAGYIVNPKTIKVVGGWV